MGLRIKERSIGVADDRMIEIVLWALHGMSPFKKNDIFLKTGGLIKGYTIYIEEYFRFVYHLRSPTIRLSLPVLRNMLFSEKWYFFKMVACRAGPYYFYKDLGAVWQAVV